MMWGVYRIDEVMEDNGVLGPGYHAWVTGTNVKLTHMCSSEHQAAQAAHDMSQRDSKTTFFIAKTFRGSMP